METKNNFLIPILMAFSVGLGLFLGNGLTPQEDPVYTSTDQGRLKKLQEVIHVLDNQYVDKIDSEELFEKTIGDMLHELDPHSNYIAAKDMQRMNEDIEGKFGGVGVRFFIIRDTICITNVLQGSPSAVAGLKAGDKILTIDGKKVAKMKITNEEVMGMLKGEEGKRVKLKIDRNGKKLDKTVTRGSIPISSIDAAYMIDDQTGFIRIERFSLATVDEFTSSAFNLTRQGMKKLIVDLRSNGGGVFMAATNIADEFLEANKLIVETKGAHEGNDKYYSKNKGTLKDVELVILINSESASASEILAGAVQDHDRGTVVGRRSFGKGLVTRDIKLVDGSNLRLTIARYYTPSGRCIQKPYNGSMEDYYSDQMDRFENGELYEVDSSYFVDSLKFKTANGRVVYGGGGIMPDVFVPVDTSGNNWYYTALRYSSAFQVFAFDYVQNKRNKWSSGKEFDKSFYVSDALVEKFTAYAMKHHDVKINRAELNQSKSRIKRYLKAEIARQLWTEQGYFRVINHDDDEVQEALKQLK